ncbi:MAG: hypothetical protein R2706_04170 [Acidimicrobiales bacterium]
MAKKKGSKYRAKVAERAEIDSSARSAMAPAPAGSHHDPSDEDGTEVRFVQPYQATKSYICPGCNQRIVVGQGHVVAVPPEAPDLRRHWHRGCWTNRHRRR